MPLTPGQVLHNRYRVEGSLGQGGMGAVYRALDLTFQATVAIKENLDPALQAQRQFEREARILYGLRHSNLPRVVDYFALQGQGQYLVMDFVDGVDLGQIVARGPVLEAQALSWIGQVLDALCYLHDQNPPIIHRDIKPANVKITPRGQAMLVDFGLAKTHNPMLSTSSGARGVTPGYAPPEQYSQQGRTDARSDLYAVGATLYALLVGQAPPESIDLVMGTAVLTPPRALNPAITPRTERAILTAMDARPTNRPQTAAELRGALVGPAAASSDQPAAKTQAPKAQPAKIRRDGEAVAEAHVGKSSGAVSPSSMGTVQGVSAKARPKVRGEIIIGIVGLALIGVVFLAVFLFARPLPEAPPPIVAPLRYVAQEGDTPVAIAAYLRVPAGDVPTDVTTGRTLDLTPGDYVIHFSGQVFQMDELADGLALEVGSRDQRYRVRVDTGVAGMQIREAYAPEEGTIVAVIGYQGGDSTIEALGVDVAAGRTWNTWYRRSPGQDLWIYSAMHDHLIPPDGDLANLKGRQVLFLGNWTSTDSVLVFNSHPEDVYVLDGDEKVYVRAAPQAVGQPLGTRYPSAVPSAPAVTGEPAEGGPDTAATRPPGLQGTIPGTVREPGVGISLRAAPSSESVVLAALFNGAKVSIYCRTAGSEISGNTIWFRILDPIGASYISSAFVELDPGYTVEAIDVCE